MPRALGLALLLAGCATAGQVAKELPTGKLFAKRQHFEAAELGQSESAELGREAVFSISWRRELVEPEFLEWTPRGW